MKTILTMFLLLTWLPAAFAGSHEHPERWYQDQWCAEKGGRTEVVLEDRTRCDCLTDSHAVEVDFGPKWSEAIGQSLYYSIQTGKRAGVLLILEKPKDRKYFIRLNSVIKNFGLPIDTWEIDKRVADRVGNSAEFP